VLGQSLAIGMALLPVLFVTASSDLGNADRVIALDLNPWSVVWRALKAMASWALTAGFIGLASSITRRSPRSGPALPRPPGVSVAVARYTREAVLPFYVLHQTPIVILGFHILQWKTSLPVKYLAISSGALVVTLCAYEVLVRRTRVTRLLFGMPPRASSVSPPVRDAAAR
jgi:hypothetical protein